MIAATSPGTGPHAGGRVLVTGAPLGRARVAMVLLHGRGASPEDVSGIAAHLALPDIAVLAPEAAGRCWWPGSFLAPLSANGPALTSALSVIGGLLDALAAEGFGPDRVVLAGFSQGACLAAEAAARRPAPYRAVAALSGGLVGTADTGGPGLPDLYGHADKRFDYEGRLDGVPILLAVHARDPHIPLARVRHSAQILTAMGADVETMTIPGASHAVVEDEARWLRGRLNDRPPDPDPEET